MDLSQVIRDIPDFPKPGILFRDITPVLENPAAFATSIMQMLDQADQVAYDKIGAIESRGFVFAGPMCVQKQVPLVLLRKEGKLPRETIAASYDLEYGQATLEMHADSIAAGERILLVDDLLATGGTAAASAELIRKAGGVVAGFLFLVELADLAGREKLAATAPVMSLVKYD
jgi:adenine phosphoribosyltransferase